MEKTIVDRFFNHVNDMTNLFIKLGMHKGCAEILANPFRCGRPCAQCEEIRMNTFLEWYKLQSKKEA